MASIYTPTSQHGRRRDVTKICETRINYRRPTTGPTFQVFLIRESWAVWLRPRGGCCDADAHALKLSLETLDDKGAECSEMALFGLETNDSLDIPVQLC